MPGDGEASFEALDPAWGNSGYWDRFQARTLALVEPELVRRRQTLERMTVSDVVLSWSRAVVPMAMVAAASAVMVLLAEPGDPAGNPGVGAEAVSTAEAPVREDESLGEALDGGPIRTLGEEGPDDGTPVVLTVAAEGF